VFRILGDDPFEQRARFGGAFLAQQALAEMGAGVNVSESRSSAAW